MIYLGIYETEDGLVAYSQHGIQIPASVLWQAYMNAPDITMDEYWEQVNQTQMGEPRTVVVLTEAQRRRRSFAKKRPRLYKKMIANGLAAVCLICRSDENIHIDHIKPISLGGTDELENLQFLCRTCNLKKGNKYELQNQDAV